MWDFTVRNNWLEPLTINDGLFWRISICLLLEKVRGLKFKSLGKYDYGRALCKSDGNFKNRIKLNDVLE
jgi:hypothetical protein